jgi:tRNA dimethylallyltransferase
VLFDTKTILLLGGPTASGKSAVAVEIAAALDAEVVNADSIQLYKGLPILTAIPSSKDQQGIPHHLYGILNHDQPLSVAYWLNLLDSCVDSIDTTCAFIATGGAGLYLSSLLYGLSPIPEVSESVRIDIRQKGFAIINSSGSDALYECVVKKDPHISGRIHPRHVQRLLRAWEVFEQTGRSIVLWQKEPRVKNKYLKSQLFVLDVDKTTLTKRIEIRCLEMIKNGVIDEVKDFVKTTGDIAFPLQKAVGFTEIKNYLNGKYSMEDMISFIKMATHRYAKRQQTWFRTQYAAHDVFFVPFDRPQAQAAAIVKHLYSTNSKL